MPDPIFVEEIKRKLCQKQICLQFERLAAAVLMCAPNICSSSSEITLLLSKSGFLSDGAELFDGHCFRYAIQNRWARSEQFLFFAHRR
jgi:hypothetical protein